MSTTQFDRDALARWYARQHINTDPGIRQVYYLPTNAPDREIRLVEINEMLATRKDDTLEPIDFAVDMGKDSEHKLLVLDVTPKQWERITKSTLVLPHNWSLQKAIKFGKKPK